MSSWAGAAEPPARGSGSRGGLLGTTGAGASDAADPNPPGSIDGGDYTAGRNPVIIPRPHDVKRPEAIEMGEDRAEIVDSVIRERRTVKVLADEAFPVTDIRPAVEALVAAAGWAPFHRVAARAHLDGALTSIVPWRFYLVDADGCRALRETLLARGDKSKIPRMLAAASALVQATWLPNPARAEHTGLFEATEENMEHVAAAGAAVQNLLLAAQARGIPNYWASGGALRGAEAFGWMGIPAGEILLGSIFLFPTETAGAEVSPGSHRNNRGAPLDWARWVTLDLPSIG